MSKYIGVLTAGGDTPGLNAALRGIGKAAANNYGMQVIGFRDGFRGLVENRFLRLENEILSGILTLGGTLLGTSRDKPHRMSIGGKILDMTDVIRENYQKHHLDALVCLGGGGTQKNALKLAQEGLNVLTLPKTIDNDVAGTDVTFGFDTALSIATEAIDRLHSTAHSHHRIIVVEIMGHKVGWLALGAGLAGGADVILIPEIPYDTEKVADAILKRSQSGKSFSIVAIAEGAISKDEFEHENTDVEKRSVKKPAENSHADDYTGRRTLRLAKRLEELTKLESRVTILGHVQRGGQPSAGDRILATVLGTKCTELINDGVSGVMIGWKNNEAISVPIEEVAGKRKFVPLDHCWVESAKRVGTNLGI